MKHYSFPTGKDHPCFKHGLSDCPLYLVWKGMWSRCTNPNRKAYKYYGGRGVSVCERWRDFNNFLADMRERPPGKTLDRIDPNGNYEPGNCRWATVQEQAHNKRRPITENSVSVLAKKSGLRACLIWGRLKRGWSIKEAIETPLIKQSPRPVKQPRQRFDWSLLYPACIKCGGTGIRHWAKGLCERCYNKAHKRPHINPPKRRFIEFQGKTMRLSEWARSLGMLPSTLGTRIKRGMPIERAMTVPLVYVRSPFPPIPKSQPQPKDNCANRNI